MQLIIYIKQLIVGGMQLIFIVELCCEVIKMKFCDKLQKLRKENNITQEQLADKLGVSRQAVSKWESSAGYPDTEKLIQLSKIFNISMDELVNDNKLRKDTKVDKINLMELLDNSLNFITKSFTLFCNMKFMGKIKCLFELLIIFLGVLIVSIISVDVIINILRNIFKNFANI